MKVMARENFETVSSTGDRVQVRQGEIIELDGAELKFHLDNGSVTKDLTWQPGQK